VLPPEAMSATTTPPITVIVAPTIATVIGCLQLMRRERAAALASHRCARLVEFLVDGELKIRWERDLSGQPARCQAPVCSDMLGAGSIRVPLAFALCDAAPGDPGAAGGGGGGAGTDARGPRSGARSAGAPVNGVRGDSGRAMSRRSWMW
jgi:hypothetical protein